MVFGVAHRKTCFCCVAKENLVLTGFRLFFFFELVILLVMFEWF